MAWDVEGTDDFAAWFASLSEAEQDAVNQAVDALIREGPALGRPFVDTIKASRHANMKELRPRGGHLRILFVFDPRRTAILLIGGNKSRRWQSWYDETIPLADDLYDQYLRELREEGAL
jgi:hypothetical protein